MSGRGAAMVIGLWALFNAALAGLLLGFRTNAVQQATWWAAVAILLVAVAIGLAAAAPRERRLPDASAGTVALAFGLAVAAVAPAVGLWAALVGGELVIVALVLLVWERRG